MHQSPGKVHFPPSGEERVRPYIGGGSSMPGDGAEVDAHHHNMTDSWAEEAIMWVELNWMCSESDGLIETVVALTTEHDATVRRDEIAKKGLPGSLSSSLLRSDFPLYKRDTPPFPCCGEAQGTLASLRQDLIVGVSYAN